MADETQQTEVVTEPTTAVAVRPAPMREMLTILRETGPEFVQAYAGEIIQREVAQARFGEDGRLARVFADSGAFSGINGDVKGVSMAMTKIQLGRSWNMQPADAMESVFFINGRPSVATKYLAAKIHDSGMAWDIGWDRDNDDNCTGCHLHLKRWNPDAKRYDPVMGKVNGVDKQAVVSFTEKDAKRAQISENGKTISLSDKWNFKSWPDDMYYNRAVGRVRNRYAPNILSGVPTREEAEDSGDARDMAPLAIAAPLAATATQSAQADIARQLKERKTQQAQAAPAAQATLAQTATTQPSAPAQTAPIQTATVSAPWKDEAGMNILMGDELKRVGETAMLSAASALGIKPGTLDHKGHVTLKFYMALKALPKFAAEAKPVNEASQPKTGDMF